MRLGRTDKDWSMMNDQTENNILKLLIGRFLSDLHPAGWS